MNEQPLLKDNQSEALLPVLKEYFGYESFRPLQEQIICDSLAGKDVLAILPTGGGKSLCFQLPALLRSGLTVVVSPLIALMKDQVDALQASGIAATFLNSTLSPDEARSRLRGLHQHQYRLLYVAPERLMLSGFLEDLQNWNVSLLAVDEAHCISEWGHDFRPEYRQLKTLRGLFPDVPVMALTATATTHVREDILKLLKLREPSVYVASFNRPNLSYRVWNKELPYSQLLQFIRARKNECGIVYCQSRKTTESVASKLCDDGVCAAPYHAGMDSADRARNQEQFLRDEIKVICATIAFGMGINKPNVRFVVHYDLPKNIEGYYQETGRAGRDSLPSECLLLFSRGDLVKQLRFIEEIENESVRKVNRDQLYRMVDYAESPDCRRASLLKYFGETWGEIPCGGCDNCTSPRETYDATLAAQKFLSCVYRIKERSQKFHFSPKHVIDVLLGSETDIILGWEHHTLSTFGIGKEHTRKEWQWIARELIRTGLLAEVPAGQYTDLRLTESGKQVLTKRNPVMLAKPVQADESALIGDASPASPKKKSKLPRGQIECDETLFERLRGLRKKLADERNVPAYIVFSDVALRQMAREYPVSPAEFMRISGVGQKKLDEFAEPFVNEIVSYLAGHSRQIFGDSDSPAPARKSLNETARDTLRRLQDGDSPEKIAQDRGFAVSTIYGHLADAAESGAALNLNQILPVELQVQAAAAFAKIGFANLAGVADLMGGNVNVGALRVFRAVHIQKSKSE